MAKMIKHYSMGRTRKELVDYVLNCSDDELFDLCSLINEHIKGITTWSCGECEKRFKPDCGYNCDDLCRKYFDKMNQPFYG